MDSRPLKPLAKLGLLVLTGGALARPLAAATVRTTLTYSAPLPAGASAVRVENLAGYARLVPGSRFQVTATVVAAGADQAEAEALAKTVRLVTSQSGGEFVVHVEYPVDRFHSYRYAPTAQVGQRQSAENGVCFFGLFCFRSGSVTIRYQDTQLRVYRGTQHGTPLYVDLAIQTPAGLHLALVNYVGLSDIRGLHNELRVKTASGDVRATDFSGRLSADTGSGDVHVRNLNGELLANTGSGDVYAERLSGKLRADTGSGDVRVSDSSGESFYADTGSGDVLLKAVKGAMNFNTGSGDVSLSEVSGSLRADTGSGDVSARNYASGDSVWVDTGSGDVSLDGDFSALRKLYIDTGSGGVALRSTADMSLHLEVSSNSGELHIDLPGARNVITRRDYFSADLGRAEGRGTISTGSGDIRVSRD